MHVPKTDEKGESKSKACNFMNVVEAQRLLRPLAVIMFSMSPGISFFSCLFIIHAATAGDRESRRFNRDGGTSRKPIIHGI